MGASSTAGYGRSGGRTVVVCFAAATGLTTAARATAIADSRGRMRRTRGTLPGASGAVGHVARGVGHETVTTACAQRSETPAFRTAAAYGHCGWKGTPSNLKWSPERDIPVIQRPFAVQTRRESGGANRKCPGHPVSRTELVGAPGLPTSSVRDTPQVPPTYSVLLVEKCGCGRFPNQFGPRHSHSMVPGGLLVTSSTTRFTADTSLVIRVEIVAITSWGRRDQSAVMASSLLTGRRTTGCP